MIRIRRAVEAEADLLSAIAKRAKAHWQYSPAQLDAWQSELAITPAQISASETFVAEDDRGICGFYSMDASSAEWEIEHFWIEPARMRRGIGRALLAHARSIAAAGGARVICIDADPNAAPFYVACGAEVAASVAAPIDADPGRRRPQLVLGLDAGSAGR